jgi:CheY-like chemotaxis protein
MSKILLVEDDNNLREIYEARLQAEGYTIASAHDGEEALVIAKEQKPDLIISDVMMPKISGFEMLDILRNTDGLKDVKVIMLTALGQSEDQKRADLLGADHYLVKSQVTLEDIVKVAQDLLNKPAAGSPDVSSPATDVPAVASTTVTPTEPPAPTQQPVVPEPVVVPEPDPVQATAPVIVPEPTVHPEITVTPLPAEAQSADDSTASVTSPTEPSVAPVVEPNSIATPEDKVLSTPDTTSTPSLPTASVPTEATSLVADSEPSSAPETPILPPATTPTEAVTPDAQSTEGEAADVEAQIEDFVAGASTQATPPKPEVSSSPTLSVEPTFVPPVTPTEPPAPTQQPVVPEPVVVPEPDPVQATAPVIVPEPTVHPEITVTPLPAEAQSADDSTASVTSPTEPSVAPVVEPNSIATPEDKAAQEIVSAKNDQVITAAAESLAARTQSIPASPPSAVAKTVQPPASDTAAAPTEPTVGTNVPIAGKKVIQPLGTDDTKPDLDTLLALEEIKASAAPETEVASAAPTGPTQGMLQAQPPTTAPTGEGDPTTPGTAEAPAQAPFDPNSIAL